MAWRVSNYLTMIYLTLIGVSISQTTKEAQEECLLYSETVRISKMCFRNITTESTIFRDESSNVISIDVDTENQCVYYTQLLPINATLSVVCLDDLTRHRLIMMTKFVKLTGIALDWTSKNVYWVERGREGDGRRIGVTSNDGKYTKTLYQGKVLGKPSDITLHPELGLLFWTDWSEDHPSISRASMAGDPESVQILVQGKDKLGWTNGIDLDLISNKLYWIDAKLDTIASVSIDGQGFKIFRNLPIESSHGYSIGISQEYIYWTNWGKSGLFRANKTGDSDVSLIKMSKQTPMGLSVWIQKPVVSFPPAKVKCPHLLLPGYDAQSKKAVRHCYCADGYNLSGNNSHVICTLNRINGSVKTESKETVGLNDTLCEEFQCEDNKTCISVKFKCDGKKDCSDGSDEKDCGASVTCSGTQFKCPNSISCIPLHWKCDGDKDCPNESEESNCEPLNCSQSEFSCTRGKCIPKRWVCDQDSDCPDGSDEGDHCAHRMPVYCTAAEFACTHGSSCIRKSWVCDQDIDCSDGSDEGDHCAHRNTTCKASTSFQCTSGKCVPLAWKCDGEHDCSDHSDERNCPTETKTTAVTRCANCQTATDGTSNREVLKFDDCLIYATGKEIRRACPYNYTYETLVREDSLIIDVDVDYQYRCIFYAILTTDTYSVKEFCRFKLPVSERERTFISNQTGKVEGLAFDWLGQNLYWLDALNKQLIVTDRANRYSSVLYEGSVFQSARDLILHPQRGLLFWTDWSPVKPAIMRASMAGDNTTIKTIVSGIEIVWPNSLTLDAENNHIYWVDAKLGRICRCGLNGEGIISTNVGRESHMFGIAVSQKYIYLSDWRTNSTFGMIKDLTSTQSRTNITTGLDYPTGMAVLPKKAKDVPTRSCPLGCPHLCLTNYLSGDVGIELVCRCSEGTTLRVRDNTHYVCLRDVPTTSTENVFDDCLVYTTGKEIRRMCPYNDTYESLVKGDNIGLTFDVDVDYSHRCIFYTTYARGSYSVKEFCPFSSPIADMGIFVSNLAGAVEGLAYDWLGQNLYWLDTDNKQLIVTDRANRYSSVLYEGSVFQSARDLTLHPQRGLLFWTDWSSEKPAIMRASMAGDINSIKDIVNGTELDWQNGLALDAENNHIYWVDTKLDRIGRCGLNGEGIITVRHLKQFSNPYGIAVSEQYIYFTDWRTSSIVGISKNPRSLQEPTQLVIGLKLPKGLAVLPKQAKVVPPPYCPWGCSQLCLIGYVEGYNATSRTCRCSEGFKPMIGDNQLISCVQETSPAPDVELTSVAPPTCVTKASGDETDLRIEVITFDGHKYSNMTPACPPLLRNSLCLIDCPIRVFPHGDKYCLKCDCR